MLASKVETELARGGAISIIKLIDHLIEEAAAVGASDIHIEPLEARVRVRFRVDGVMQEIHNFPKIIQQEVISRIKVMANLRTDEQQAAQDGRLRFVLPDTTPVDIRISVAPTYHGESAVLRLLTDKAEPFTLETLGFGDSDREKILCAIQRPHGMILATGPTGSGKTTTLYTLLKLLNTPEVSIITIEDPIEYAITDIKQIQVNPRTGLTFANGLRSILRQDPDVIMVGEIRDRETAALAVNTALTGHRLLSTLHTANAVTTLPRLLDMRIEPFLVASTISLAIGQRLVRRICRDCTEKQAVNNGMRASWRGHLPVWFIKQTRTLARGRGCETCRGSGYRGRVSINEVLVVDGKIREAVLRKAPAGELHKTAVGGGMTAMLEDGCRKVLAGLTTVEEILRAVHD